MSENIGSIYNTQIPAYEDSADIKAALKLYHYGQASEPATLEDVPAESIAGHLIDLQDQIDTISSSAGIQATIVDAKGDLIVATGADTVTRKPVGTNNQVLAADSAETTGVKWTAATDLVSAASTSVAGKVQLEDSVSSTSNTKAATPNSVKTVNDSVNTLAASINPSIKTADYTLQASDSGKVIITNINSGTNVITVPLQASGQFADNARIDILQIGSVQTTINPASGVTINSKYGNKKLSVQYSAGTLIKLSDNNWVLIGDLTA